MKLSVLRSAVGLVAVPYGQALPQQRSGPGIATATSSDHPVPTDIMFLARVVSLDAPDFDGMIMGQFHPTWESSIADLWRPLPDDSNVIDWDYVFVDVDAEGEPTLFWNRVGTQYAGTVYRDKENMPLIVMDPANASEDDEEKRIKGLYTNGYGLVSKLGDDKFTFTACRTDEQSPSYPLPYVSYLDDKRNPLAENCVPIQFNATNAKKKSSNNPWDPPEGAAALLHDLRKRMR